MERGGGRAACARREGPLSVSAGRGWSVAAVRARLRAALLDVIPADLQ